MKISELFLSIQGESLWSGWPCGFIRLVGCPLRCRWCDTAYAFRGGTDMTEEAILNCVEEWQVSMVEITGGEPLSQEGTPSLIQKLLEKGYRVLLETSGSLDIGSVDPRTHIIMDIKAPGSRMDHHNLWSNLSKLKPHHEIKCVISSQEDFFWFEKIFKEKNFPCPVSLSPAWGLLDPKDLASWILNLEKPVRLNLQLHKYIWGPKKRGV